jgi:PilZ domain
MAKGQQKIFVERAERHPVSMRGFALSPTRDSDVRVRNISYTGCQLASDDKFAEGEIVELRIIKRGAMQAEVRWSAKGCAGARFID